MSRRRAASRIAAIALLGGAALTAVAVAEPVTGFEVAPDPPTAGAAATFTAQDPCEAPVTCVWDFGDGRVAASGKVVEHTYALPGPVTVSLTTDDTSEDVPAVTTTRTLEVLPPPVLNRAPEASVSAAPVRPLTNETVQFDSTASSDPDGDALTREWDLDGDGRYEPVNDQTRPFRDYATDGPRTVSVRVTDPDGASDVATVEITVLNRPPRVSLATTNRTPLSDEEITFTATGVDVDGTVASYAWDLDGRGFAPPTTDEVRTTRFPLPGRRTVRVRVTDDDDATAVGSLTIDVGNRAPTASFAYDPPLVVRGQPVDFAATAEDPEGRLGEIQWDFGGDGVFDATGPTARHTFPASRDPLSVVLRVTDQDGGSVESTKVIVAGNLAPTATVSASPETPYTGDPVSFTATAADRDGTVTYAWDLDDDGAFDDAFDRTASTTFAAPGRKLVRLEVTDDDGASVTVEQEVTVQARPATASQAPPATLPETPTVPAPSPPTTRPLRTILPFPVVRFAGALSPGGARLTLFTVTAPRGARISVRCRGRGCPRARALRSTGVTRIRALQRGYRAGVRIDVWVTRANRIGKHVRITIRNGKPPARRDSCLWPGSRKPRACP